MSPPTPAEPRAGTVPPAPAWPDGKRFAFSVFDDADMQTLANGQPVYDLLTDLGLRTTKSVWMFPGTGGQRWWGETCEDAPYRRWALALQGRGFEIGLHNVASCTSTREETLRGFAQFAEIFGHPPRTLANHTGCRESIYWGSSRLTGARRWLYRRLTRGRARDAFEGDREGSALFWGDVCRDRVTYVRNFVFGDVNTLRACPWMPYHDPGRPYVRYWFASSEGPDVDAFVRMLSPANQDRLCAEGGACIMYTHFGQGFVRDDGRLDPRFVSLMTRLRGLDGWFVPVATLLDHLRATRGHHDITDRERARLERRWLLHKVRTRGTT